MIKKYFLNYGFEKNQNQLNETWVKHKTLFYSFRVCAAFFGIAVYIY